jgi:N6-adenosine-specific RNA methylase IME4
MGMQRATTGIIFVTHGRIITDLYTPIAAGERFAVIHADPPWRFRTWDNREAIPRARNPGTNTSAAIHYDTMTLADIKALPVAELAANDCALFLWACLPQIPEALDVIAAWGFEFKTVAFVWIKTNPNDRYVGVSGVGLHWGMGYWTRANAEVVMLATRGSPSRVDEGVHQVIISPVSEHSRKPDEVQLRIERLMYGSAPVHAHDNLELFARRAAPGWTVWGNDVRTDLFTHDVCEATHGRSTVTEADLQD